jgi:hypothetical protein
VKDDAVAPVIAVMLILAALATFLAIWNAVYVPSMKESAEVAHIESVESAFQHFASDIEYAASSHQNHLSFTEPVQLGGGDFMLNTLRSSGSLYVQNEQNPIYTITFYSPTNETPPIGEMNGTLANFSYEPSGNFWQNQGYRWQYGYINVTNGQTIQTPLGYYNMTDVSNAFNSLDSPLAILASSFGEVDYTVNQTEFPTLIVTNILPNSGGSDTPVTITGSGFTGATNVTFGTIPVTAFTVTNDTLITTTSPAQAAGTVDVTVTTPFGTSATSLADQYNYSGPQTYSAGPTPTSYSPHLGICSSLVLLAVNITASPDHSFISSNGFGTLKLTSNVTSIPYIGVTNISFGSDQEPFGNATFESWNTGFTKVDTTCWNNIQYNSGSSNATFSQYDILQSVSPVNVTLNVVEIQISAY